MAEEKKKIDLKARLKKDATPAPPPAASSGGGAVVPPAAASSAPATPGMSGPGIPVPAGVSSPSTHAALDPSNPLAVAAGTATRAPAAAAQRIEVDETEVHAAASKARRTGLIIGLFIAVLVGGGMFMVGNASNESAGRAQAKRDAQDLKKNVEGASKKLEEIASKLEEAQKSLSAKPGERKFPADLGNTLGGMKVDFDGSQLAGRRFAGFKPETVSGLVDFITGVQAMEDNKTAIKNIVTKLSSNKTFVEQFNAPASGGQAEYVVLLGGPTGKDPKGNNVALVSRLATPLQLSPTGGPAGDMPKDFAATNPLNPQGGNVSAPVYKGGDIKDPTALYIVPKSFDNVCPPETKSAAGQLTIKLQDLITQIRGEGKPADDMAMVQDVKPGLIQRATTLADQLGKI